MEAAHSQYVTVGAGVVNIVMTVISVSDLERPFPWGGRGGPKQVPCGQTGAPQSPLRGAGGTGPGSPQGHGLRDMHILTTV